MERHIIKRFYIIGYIACCLFVFNSFALSQLAVQNQYKFKYLTINQGLSNNNIRSICQDSKGFIWIGTQNGLNKFDGISIVSYRNNPDVANTISSNFINSILLDSKNNLWIGTREGLDIYNNDLDNFIKFTPKNLDIPFGNVESVIEDKRGNIWIAAESGLCCYNLKSKDVQFFNNQKGNPNNLPSSQVYRLLADKDNKIWVSILNEGLYLFNPLDSTLKCFKNDPENTSSLSSNRIESIYEDSEGQIWCGTFDNGLNLYNPKEYSFLRIIPELNNTYSTRVRAMFEDLKGNFFIGTRAGLYIKDAQSNKFLRYAYEGHIFSNLSQNSILCSFIDKTGTLWVGTFSGGVNYTNLNKKEFVHYTAGKKNNHFLSGGIIYALTEDSIGNLWVGGDNGLNYLDRTTHTFRYYFNNPNDPNSLSYNDVKSLEWDKKGNNLWIGTNKGGLNYLNIKTGKFKSYRHNPEDPYSIAGDKVYCLMFDNDENLWIILTPNNDFESLYIDILPKGSDKFTHLNEVSYFGLDHNKYGDVYIGGVNGFWIFSKRDSIFSFISNEKHIGNVNTIRKDSKDRIWIGSNKGLVRYNLEDKSFLWYSENNGYPLDEVFGIVEDDSHNLWVSTNNGLIKITNIVLDTSNIRIRVFDQEDGLQSKQFNYNAYYKSKTGEVVFGGINGFNTFFPDRIIENEVPADVILTNLKVFNSTVPIGKKLGGTIILKKSISVADEITLGPKHNVFTLEFASLQNANPEKETYKYKLEGFDKDWQYRKARNNFVTYTNLPAGKYTFIITASNNDGIWNEVPVTLKITIIPPVWKTWWFRLSVVLVFIGLILGIYFYRVKSIRQKNIFLEQTVTKRTHEITINNKKLISANNLLEEKQEEIVTQNEELSQHRNHLESLVNDRTLKLKQALEKAKESDQLKSAFLANMSHEIRTPMNAITGFSGLLNESEITSEERAEFIEIIQSNSKSLLKIIDEILDLSMIESNQLKIVKETFDLNVILDHLYSYYYLNSSNTEIKIQKNNTLENLNLKLYSDSVRIKQIITNLMDNAFKFTEKGYIELGAYTENEALHIYVKDTGRGIPTDNIDKIFQQFTKVEDNEAEWTQGLGLGLAISQKIAEVLGGYIYVKSSRGKGSIFTFSIPMVHILTKEEVVVEELKAPVPARWEGKTILIAEDVEANYYYLKKVLRKTQTNIIWARNGQDALKEAIENPNIDLILMDIKMPIMNGYEAAKKIKENNPNQIIVAQTAYARAEEKLNFYDENFDEYLSKPINPASLLLVLERFL